MQREAGGWLLVVLAVACGQTERDPQPPGAAEPAATGGTSGAPPTAPTASAGTSSTQPTWSSLMDFYADWVTTYCEGSHACCARLDRGFDLAACLAAREAALDDDLVELDARGYYQLDPALGARCLEELALLSCDAPMPDACWDALAGTLPAGATCIDDLECAQPAGSIVYCEPADSTGATDERCVQYTAPQAGAPCGETCTLGPASLRCTFHYDLAGTCFTNLGYYCSETHTCAALRELGDSCRGSEECASGLVCLAGACALPLALGEPCAGASGPGGPCVDGAHCASTGTCEPLLAAGDQCLQDGQCPSDLCDPDFCQPVSLLHCQPLGP